MQQTEGTQVQSLGREDPQGEGVATHSSILAWRIPWTEEPGRLRSMGLPRDGHDWATNTFNRFCVGFKVNQELVQTVLVCLFKTNLFPWYTHLLSDQTRLCGRQKRGRRSVCPLDSCLCHLCTTSTLYTSSPQSFRHHGLVSWKTIFHGPWRGDDFRMIQMHYFYCACCYYSTSSTSDHQALGLGGWRPQV